MEILRSFPPEVDRKWAENPLSVDFQIVQIIARSKFAIGSSHWTKAKGFEQRTKTTEQRQRDSSEQYDDVCLCIDGFYPQKDKSTGVFMQESHKQLIGNKLKIVFLRNKNVYKSLKNVANANWLTFRINMPNSHSFFSLFFQFKFHSILIRLHKNQLVNELNWRTNLHLHFIIK